MFRIFYQRLVRIPWTNITETSIFIPSMYSLANNTLVQLLAKMLQLQFSFLPFLVFMKINHHHSVAVKQRGNGSHLWHFLLLSK